MKRSFLLLPTLLFAGLFSAMPAQASPEAQACLNKLVTRPEQVPDSAELLLTVDHEGSQYHVIQENYDRPRAKFSTVYIKTDKQGGCEKLMSYLKGSFPTVEVYEERLGVEVFQKIRQMSQSQPQPEPSSELENSVEEPQTKTK